jgi:hypothetical protein
VIEVIFVGMSCRKESPKISSIYNPIIIIKHKSAFSSHIQKRLDRIAFDNYEKIVSDYSIYVPHEYVIKFLKFQDTTFYSANSTIIGQGVVLYAKRYKMFILKQFEKERGHWIMVTYNYANKQIDLKSFLFYCRQCKKNDLLTLYSFVPNKDDEFFIHYYYPTKSKAEPCFENVNVLKKVKWIVDSTGVFMRDK